jgi:hypothetical protein
MSGLLKTAPEEVVYETVRLKLKLQWISQEVRNARNIEYLQRKVAGREQNQ